MLLNINYLNFCFKKINPGLTGVPGDVTEPLQLAVRPPHQVQGTPEGYTSHFYTFTLLHFYSFTLLHFYTITLLHFVQLIY